MSETRILWMAIGWLAIGSGLMGIALCYSIYYLRKVVIGLQRSLISRTNDQMEINRNLLQSTRSLVR